MLSSNLAYRTEEIVLELDAIGRTVADFKTYSNYESYEEFQALAVKVDFLFICFRLHFASAFFDV